MPLDLSSPHAAAEGGLYAERRFGRFHISQELVKSGNAAVSQVMAACIVTRCEMRFLDGAFEYEALSPQFNPVSQGCVIPLYRWVAAKEGNAITVRAVLESPEP